MNDDKDNPRKLQMAVRCFERGLMGHRFSRPLTPTEGKRLREMIESNGHGSCIFIDENRAPVGAWICTCEKECEPLLIVFAADLKISIVAQAAGEKSYIMADENHLEIQTQTIGAADQARALQVASVASQVSMQIATEVATKISQEVAHATTVATLCNASEHAASVAAEPQLIFHQERLN